LCQVAEIVWVEGENRSGDNSCATRVCEIEHEKIHRIHRKEKRGKQNQIVAEYRIIKCEVERKREQSLWQKRFGKREGIGIRIKNVRVEQIEWIGDERMPDPRDDPNIEQSVLLVFDCMGDVKDKWIRHHACKCGE
jgi:hypothetical protein